MTKGGRRILKICIVVAVLSATWGLMVLYSHFMEPVFAERDARKFLQARSLTLEQFSGPVFRRTQQPGGFNSFIWTLQDGDQLLNLVVEGYGDLICLYYYEASIGEIYRTICQNSDGGERRVKDCLILPASQPLVEHCQPVSLRIPAEAKQPPR